MAKSHGLSTFARAPTYLGGGPRAIAGVAVGNADALDEVRALVEQGALRSVIAERFPFERIASAHASFERSRPRGSVVVEMSEAVDPGRAALSIVRQVA